MRVWIPELLLNVKPNESKSLAVIVLNRPISLPIALVKSLWQSAALRSLVDGGANHWYRFLKENCSDGELAWPDYISGDFDSINQKTLTYFKENNPNVEIVATPRQNETDFTKALVILEPELTKKHIDEIVVLQEFSGRFDQIMANINTLYKYGSSMMNPKLYLLSSTSMTWLLRPGENFIRIPNYLFDQQRWCSLLPIGEKAVVTTDGLKWDLSESVLNFGGLVSSSNTYSKMLVKIVTDNYIVWSMGLLDLDENTDSEDEVENKAKRKTTLSETCG